MQVRCLVDVPGEKLPASLAEYLASNVAPQVPEAMRRSFLEAVESGNIRSMQNKLMPAAPLHRPGALLLGDAFNMRHPLTGESRAPRCCCSAAGFCADVAQPAELS